MGRMGRTAFDKSQRTAVTIIARDFTKAKAATIERDVDRPHAFTKRGYNWDGAKRGSGPIESRSYVRPKQAKYLDLVEYGGVRGANGKDRPMKPKSDIVDPFGGLYGRKGLEKKFLGPSRRRAAAAGTRKAGTGKGGSKYATGAQRYAVMKIGDKAGLWQMTRVSKSAMKGKRKYKGRAAIPGRRGQAGRHFGGKLEARWKTRLIVEFARTARYKPTLHFHRDARRYGRKNFAPLARRLFQAELRKQLSRR